MRLTWCFSYGAIAIFMVFKLREILTETPVTSTPSVRVLQEDNPPTYDDVVQSHVQTESEVPWRRPGPGYPPPYSKCI